MAVTIKQIATISGVSRGTVDRVLHERPGVNPDVAERVRKIADDLGYVPNRAGRVLAARKQPIKIGCFLPSIGNPFFDDVIRGFHKAESELSDFGVSVELRTVKGYDAKTHISAIRELAEMGCSGLCISTVDTEEIQSLVNGIIDAGTPVITVNTDLTRTKRLCYVGPNYLKAGSAAAGLLALMTIDNLNILIVTGSNKMKAHNDRVCGFSRTLHHKHVPYRLVDVFESLDNDDHAYKMAMDTLKQHSEINCVFVVAAGVEGVCNAINDLGLAQKIRVLTYDDIPATKQFVMDGVIDCTICQEPKLQGTQSIHRMFEYLINDRRKAPKDCITSTVIKIHENI